MLGTWRTSPHRKVTLRATVSQIASPDVQAAVHVGELVELRGPVTDELRAAREALANAIGNVDILLNLWDAIR